MNTNERSNDTLLLGLGLASFILWPLTALPGILVGLGTTRMGNRGRIGYALCWTCLIVFLIAYLPVFTREYSSATGN